MYKVGDFVGPGERMAAERLARGLPDSWDIICNRLLVAPNGITREVDFIVIGEHSVFAVEEKYWSGRITGDDYAWHLNGGESRSNPITQADKAAKHLAGMLRSKVPSLKKNVGYRHFVAGHVLLSNDKTVLEIDDPRINRVSYIGGVADDLVKADELMGKRGSIGSSHSEIVDLLAGLKHRPSMPKKINIYMVQERLRHHGTSQTFRAQHPDGSDFWLKVVERPASHNKAALEMAENFILREYEVLRRLEEKKCAPHVDPYFLWNEETFWVFPINPVKGKNLRTLTSSGLPKWDGILNTTIKAFEQLAVVHSEEILHRALSPDTIFIDENKNIIFADFSYARIDGGLTVSPFANALMSEDPYRAPECRKDMIQSSPPSDIYSLAQSLLSCIVGKEPEEEPINGNYLSELRPDLDQSKATLLGEILGDCSVKRHMNRPEISEVIKRLKKI